MDRRTFLAASAALGLQRRLRGQPSAGHRLPDSDSDYRRSRSYIEETPIQQYHWASEKAAEAFRDMKYGVRLHWGIYSIIGQGNESWPFLTKSLTEKDQYNQLYKTWNPQGFDADAWTSLFEESGMKMLAFTSKHHEGFSMFDTRTRVRKRVNYLASGGPKIEDCNLAYSIMETPFRRDVIKELTTAAHKRSIKVDLYFSHTDWYDADFRPYGFAPLQVPSAPQLELGSPTEAEAKQYWQRLKARQGGLDTIMAPDPTPEEVNRMVARHRSQITELLTNYGDIAMMCLDIWWGPSVWPQLRQTLMEIRKIQPDVMLRGRGIGNYADYYTPERFVPNSKANTQLPWFVIFPLGSSFSYERDPAKYKGPGWIVHNLVDSVAKGGNFMVGVGPDGTGRFHPTAIEQLKQAGNWLKVNGEGIYATRARDGDEWSEGDNVRYSRSKDGRTIYCFLLNWPGRTVTLKSIPDMGDLQIQMLGDKTPLVWRRDPSQGMIVNLPEAWQDAARRPCEYAWGLKISRAPAKA